MRKFSLLLALFAGMMLPLSAVAQDSGKTSSSSKKKSSKKKASAEKNEAAQVETPVEPPVELTFSSEQIMLNNQAVEASAQGEFKKAEQIFNAMLQIGEFNIIWLNLANAYLMQDKCMETAEALKHVYTAPRITDIPHEKVEEKAALYAQQMNDKCSSKLTLVCNPPEMTVTIDGGQEMACISDPIALVPGRHVVYGQTSFGFNTAVANTVAYETTELKVDVIDYETVAKDAGVTPEELRKKSTLFKALGYSFIGVGVAALGSGIGLSTYYYFDYKDKYKQNQSYQSIDSDQLRKIRKEDEKYMNVGYGLAAVGGAMLVAGIVLVVVDVVKYQPQIEKLESGLSFAPAFSPEFTGFSLSTRF